jgi:glycine/D-amino acid oxidase-like deaminating enzyme
MSNAPEVLVIGGGVIGLTTAYYLARDGVHVTVVDQADFGRQASWAGFSVPLAVLLLLLLSSLLFFQLSDPLLQPSQFRFG